MLSIVILVILVIGITRSVCGLLWWLSYYETSLEIEVDWNLVATAHCWGLLNVACDENLMLVISIGYQIRWLKDNYNILNDN
jgi:hypothetical protein